MLLEFIVFFGKLRFNCYQILLTIKLTSSFGFVQKMTRTLCVVGGGIAGVSCMLELIENAEQDKDIEFVFICGKSGFIKTVENYEKVCLSY